MDQLDSLKGKELFRCTSGMFSVKRELGTDNPLKEGT